MNNKELNVQGFKASAVEANIRYSGRLDLGLIYSEVPAVAAGVFTTSFVKAAPVLLDQQKLHGGRGQAIMVNAGIANACTGEQGMKAAKATSKLASDALQIDDNLMQVCSTGVIGEQMEVERFETAMDGLVASLSTDGLKDVAQAMMTTDTVPKTAVREVEIGGKRVKLAGLAKGAGMIMPNMATMLAFIVCDANVSADFLQDSLRSGVELSFNAITVDGDTSTNDTVIVLANGMAGNDLIDGGNADLYGPFQLALNDLLKDLAWQIVKDGEGATKFVTIKIIGAMSQQQAKNAAQTIANSPLVKTAFFGEDANWGRIIAALGRSGAEFDQNKVDISFDNVIMVENGLGQGPSAEKKASSVLKKDNFTVTVDLKAGGHGIEVYTCDFSLDYVKINADYRS